MRTTNCVELAKVTRFLVWRRRQKAIADVLVYDLHRKVEVRSSPVVERNVDGSESTALSAIEEASCLGMLAENLFYGDTVEQRLEDRAAGQWRRWLIRSLPRLVIGNPQVTAFSMPFEQINRSAYKVAAIEPDSLGPTCRIAGFTIFATESECKLKINRLPFGKHLVPE